MRTISFQIDDRADALLRSFSKRLGLSQTDALKAAIKLLDQQHRPSPTDLAVQLGLIGGFRSGEGDLAVNHSQRLTQRLRSKLQCDSPASPSTRGSVGAARRKAGPG